MLWRRPLSAPPWLGALLLIGAILFAISALPMLASAITPDTGNSESSTSAAAAKGTKAGSKAADGAKAKAGNQAQGDVVEGRAMKLCPGASPSPSPSASPTSGDSGATDCTDPLPRSGGASAPRIATAVALVFGGLVVLSMIGFSGERPWPGRYVRRI